MLQIHKLNHFKCLLVDSGLSSLAQHPPSRTAPPHNTPTQDSPEAGTRKRRVGRCSPHPIAVFGSKPQSPRQADHHEGSRSGSLVNTDTVGVQTSGSLMESEPGSNVEIISMEEGSVHFSEELHVGKNLIKPMEIIEESEQDFISLEAQKLTGVILQESQLKDDPEAENLDLASPLPEEHNENTPSDGIKEGSESELHGVGLASVCSGGSITLVEAVEVGVADMAEEHDKEMTSRSSTIFVDMTGLNIQSHEDLETQS